MLPFALVLAQNDAAPHGLNPAFMDRSVVVRSPADLYAFANGRWVKAAKVPEDRSATGTFFDAQDRAADAMRRACEEEERARRPLSTLGGKVGLMYRLATDEARANRLGVEPLREEMARIDAVRDRAGLMRVIARLGRIGAPVGLESQIGEDDKDVSRVLLHLSQDRLMLPRAAYLGEGERPRALRAALLAREARFLSLAGVKDAETQAERAIALETELARASSTPEELRSPEANYRLTDQAGLRSLAPNAPWSAYFAEMGIGRPKFVNVRQPSYLRAFDALVASRPIADWRAELRCRLLTAYAPHLSDEFVQANQALARAQTGQQASLPRWRRAVATVNSTIGEALGQLYVREAFSPEDRARARAMVDNVLAALDERLGELAWMSEPTRAEARAKIRRMGVRVGYPDRWRDYSRLRLRDDSLAANVMRARGFEWERRLAKLGRPADRSDWSMTPTTVNANYDANQNRIEIPAAILQRGFFDPKADDASNYGGAGMVIAHEITHGFDDVGSQYDGAGLRRDWWTREDKARYDAIGEAIVAQYGAYRSPSGLKVNGRLTQGENMADVGALSLAHAAYRRSLKGVEPPVVDGLTGDQRFFVAFAQVWRRLARPERERQLLEIDEHSPGTVRVQGAATNLPAFYRAFGLPVPEELPKVW